MIRIMKKILILIFGLLIMIPACYPQIEEIKEKSDKKHKEENEADTDTKGKTNSLDTDDEEDEEDEFESEDYKFLTELFGTLFSGVGKALYKHHKIMVKDRDIYKNAFCFEPVVEGGYKSGQNLYIMQPNISGTWGIFSSDLRLNYMDKPNTSNYSTIDWQILQLNFMWTPKFSTKIGSGIFFENYNDEVYNEHSMFVTWDMQ